MAVRTKVQCLELACETEVLRPVVKPLLSSWVLVMCVCVCVSSVSFHMYTSAARESSSGI